jgi:hypothetical protein
VRHLPHRSDLAVWCLLSAVGSDQPVNLHPTPAPPIPQVVPILRAGLVLLEQAGTVLPISETYHVGYVRNEETLQVGTSRSSFSDCEPPVRQLQLSVGRCVMSAENEQWLDTGLDDQPHPPPPPSPPPPTITPQATSYLNKLPKQLSPEDKILITDPMLATGGTMLQVGGRWSACVGWRGRVCGCDHPH